MNNYIVDPSTFYWIGVLTSIRNLLIILGIFAFVVALLNIIFSFLDNKKIISKGIIVATIVTIMSFLIISFIPTKETFVEMLIAKAATFDNVNWTVQQIKEIIDYVILATKEIL